MDPAISVIIAAYNARDTIRSCLVSLASQSLLSSLEVLVVDSSIDGTADIVARDFPWVRLIRLPKRAYCGEARNNGRAWSRGRIIAQIDADCTARENWAEEILKAHKTNAALAIGGAIANRNPQNLVAWAAYFTEFSSWMPGSPEGARTDIAGANISYKREAFDQFGPFIDGTYCSDTEFHWRLAQKGLFPHFSPAIQVSHQSIASWSHFLWHEFHHGRSFARVRTAARCFTGLRRTFYALSFFLIAVKLLLHISMRNIQNAVYRKHFLISLPLITLGVLAWSLGEASGYLGPRLQLKHR